MSVLELTGVRKSFAEKTAVNDITFRVQSGEIYGLLGGNGAGKTTTMRMILGIIYPDAGHIHWSGKPIDWKESSLFGYLPEERGLYPKVKVADQIIYLAELRGISRKEADRELKNWLERFEVPEYYNMKVEELSKGNQQKIQFIASIIHNPDILILDEAFSGLDPVNVELLKGTVKEMREKGKAILFSSHRMEHVEELCENITILHRSNTVIQGNMSEIKRSFPREKVILQTEGDVSGLELIQGVDFVEKRVGQQYLIHIHDENEAPQKILHHAMQQSVVTRFEVLEPTLNDIFIKTVGERHE